MQNSSMKGATMFNIYAEVAQIEESIGGAVTPCFCGNVLSSSRNRRRRRQLRRRTRSQGQVSFFSYLRLILSRCVCFTCSCSFSNWEAFNLADPWYEINSESTSLVKRRYGILVDILVDISKVSDFVPLFS